MNPQRDSRIARLILVSFFLFAIGYGAYEAQGILTGPEILIQHDTWTERSGLATISGRAVRMSELRMNGARISVTESGEFNEKHVLAPGTNHIVFEAQDARGRTDTRSVSILYLAEPLVLPIPQSSTSTATTTGETAYTVQGNHFARIF